MSMKSSQQVALLEALIVMLMLKYNETYASFYVHEIDTQIAHGDVDLSYGFTDDGIEVSLEKAKAP